MLFVSSYLPTYRQGHAPPTREDVPKAPFMDSAAPSRRARLCGGARDLVEHHLRGKC